MFQSQHSVMLVWGWDSNIGWDKVIMLAQKYNTACLQTAQKLPIPKITPGTQRRVTPETTEQPQPTQLPATVGLRAYHKRANKPTAQPAHLLEEPPWSLFSPSPLPWPVTFPHHPDTFPENQSQKSLTDDPTWSIGEVSSPSWLSPSPLPLESEGC